MFRGAEHHWFDYRFGDLAGHCRIDRSEIYDLAAHKPEVVNRLAAAWESWAESVGVIPWDQLRGIVTRLGG